MIWSKHSKIGVEINSKIIKTVHLKRSHKEEFELKDFRFLKKSKASDLNQPLKKQSVIASIACSDIFIKKIRLSDKISENRLEELAWTEVASNYQIALDQIYLDFAKILVNDVYYLLIVASRNEVVDQLIKNLIKYGFSPHAIDVDCFSLERIGKFLGFNGNIAINDNVIIMLDLSIDYITLVALRDSRILYWSQIRHKIVNKEGGKFETIFEIKQESLLIKKQIITVINNLITDFLSKNPNYEIDMICLSGEFSLMDNIKNILSEYFKTKTILSDPFQFISINNEIDREELIKISPALALPCGLAMRC